jgi:hypothetical protein
MLGREASALDVARIDDELVVGIAGRRRRIALPAAFARLEVERVSVDGEELVIAFGGEAAP